MLVNIIWRNRPIFYDKYHKNSPYISVLLYSKNCLKNKHHIVKKDNITDWEKLVMKAGDNNTFQSINYE